MKFTSKKNWLLTLASIGALSASPAIAANIAANGGFEVQGVGGPLDSAQWTEFAGGPGSFSVRGGPPAAGLFAADLLANGGPGVGGVAGINQNSITDVGLLSLAPGTMLSASFDYDFTAGPGAVGFAELKILNGVGAIVGSTGLLALPPTAGYTPFATPAIIVPAFAPAPNDVYASFLEIVVNAGAFAGSTGSARIDNVVINGTLVPEPASAAFLGLGLLGMLRRRRR